MNPEATWSIGLFVGLAIAAVIVAVCLTGAVILGRWLRAHEKDAWDYTEAKWLRRGCLAVAALVVVFTAGMTFPWESAYHRYEPKVGEVERIEKRIVGGDSIEEKFAVRLAGDPTEYGCLDTRCALVQPGDELALKCIKRWDYQGTDGYDCRWVGMRKAS